MNPSHDSEDQVSDSDIVIGTHKVLSMRVHEGRGSVGELDGGERAAHSLAGTGPPADFAAVAVATLTRDEHAGKVYIVTGPASLTHAEQIRLIGEAHGRPLRFEELDEAAARQAISPYAPADVLFETWQKHLATPAPVTSTIERVTGRPPRSVQQWAADYPI